jgi:hypothetical protein
VFGIAFAAILCKASGPVLLALLGGFSVAASLGLGLISLGVIAGGTGIAALVRRRRAERDGGGTGEHESD